MRSVRAAHGPKPQSWALAGTVKVDRRMRGGACSRRLARSRPSGFSLGAGTRGETIDQFGGEAEVRFRFEAAQRGARALVERQRRDELLDSRAVHRTAAG